MMTNRREYNKQETIRHIRSVFMRRYAEGGIDGITVSALCKDCGIAKSTFYLYFEDKYQILESVENDTLAALREICQGLRKCTFRDNDPGQPLVESQRIIRYLSEHRDTLRALMGKNGDPRFTYKWKKNITEAFHDNFRNAKGSNAGADIACTIFSSSLIGLYTLYLFDEAPVTERELAIALVNLARFSLYEFEALAGNN